MLQWLQEGLNIVFIYIQSRDKRLPVFVRGEPVLALKSSSLRGNVLLSTALFVRGEVLIGARAKRALLMRPVW